MERALAKSRDRQEAPKPARRRIRMMIVDDSMIARAVLSRIIESAEAFEIAAVAGTAEDAIDALHAVKVDIVLLDLEMPGAGGLKLIPDILKAAGGARVMIVSSLADDGKEHAVAALALGAVDAMPKPGTSRFNGRFSEVLLAKLKAIGFADRHRPIAQPIRLQGCGPLRAMPSDPIGLLAIGASTGGIHALSALFQALPHRIHVPILVTQHLPSPFMSVFARQLGVAARREALVAEDGTRLLADRILIAPGDAHLTIEPDGDGHVARLVRGAAPSGCLPSVDPMLASAGVDDRAPLYRHARLRGCAGAAMLAGSQGFRPLLRRRGRYGFSPGRRDHARLACGQVPLARGERRQFRQRRHRDRQSRP